MPLTNAMQMIAENRLLSRWADLLDRRPDQQNRPQETDAELVPLPDGKNLLCTTVDTIAEEIALGFYKDPETIGWMGATVSLSDLAAVGSRPLGLVVSVTLPKDCDPSFQEGIARGLDAACRANRTFVLGGDTNSGETASITSCALGLVPADRPLKRTGCKPGQLVYATGPLGAGSASAARALLDIPTETYSEADYRPQARIDEAQILSGFAKACMDTSDGLVATLDQLMRLNHVGFELTTPLMNLLEPRSRQLCQQLGVPPLLFLAGHHGEFELVFTVDEEDRDRFENHARINDFTPLLLGRTIAKPVIRIAGDPPRLIDSARIRNLLGEVDGNLVLYLAELSRVVNSDRQETRP
jgi:thiamine-monophosphate kinase